MEWRIVQMFPVYRSKQGGHNYEGPYHARTDYLFLRMCGVKKKNARKSITTEYYRSYQSSNISATEANLHPYSRTTTSLASDVDCRYPHENQFGCDVTSY